MPRGLSLHIGVNVVDPNHYGGWDGRLNACEADAKDMKAIADACGYQAKILLTQNAKRQPLVDFLRSAAQQLQSGDIFLLTYSGHGGQLPDLNDDEDDSVDETWCLYDGQMVDDELNALYRSFRAGVRGFVLSDSCHSGTMLKNTYYSAAAAAGLGGGVAREFSPVSGSTAYKFMPDDVARRTYDQNKKFYDEILGSPGSKEAKAEAAASVRLISGCQDNQYSMDGPFNGAFTSALLKVWRQGQFDGDYHDFHIAIQNRLPPSQSPNHFKIGPSLPAFDAQKPFTI